MSEHGHGEHEEHGAPSHLPGWLRLSGCLACVGFAFGGPMVEAVTAGNWVAVFLFWILAHVLAKFFYRMC